MKLKLKREKNLMSRIKRCEHTEYNADLNVRRIQDGALADCMCVFDKIVK